MTSLVGAPTRHRAAVPGTFARSMLAAAARGLGLVGVAVLVGVLLLRATDDIGSGGGGVPNLVISGADETTTTTEEIDAVLRPPTQVSVIVFNAARKPGLAGQVTESIRQLGYQTLEPSNLPQQPDTIVYFKPGFDGEAAALAPKISPTAHTEPEPDPSSITGAEGADLVVTLGTDFDSAGATTPTS